MTPCEAICALARDNGWDARSLARGALAVLNRGATDDYEKVVVSFGPRNNIVRVEHTHPGGRVSVYYLKHAGKREIVERIVKS